MDDLEDALGQYLDLIGKPKQRKSRSTSRSKNRKRTGGKTPSQRR
jgi:hypothetical protein